MTNLASILDLNPGWIEAYGVWDDAMHGFLTESLGWGTRATIEGKAPWQVFMLAGQTPGAGGGGGGEQKIRLRIPFILGQQDCLGPKWQRFWVVLR